MSFNDEMPRIHSWQVEMLKSGGLGSRVWSGPLAHDETRQRITDQYLDILFRNLDYSSNSALAGHVPQAECKSGYG